VAIMLRKDKYVEQILSIDQFVFLLSDYISYEQITNVHSDDQTIFLEMLSYENLNNFMKLFMPLHSALCFNSKVLKGATFAPIVESKINKISNFKRSYKVRKLLDWMESNLELDELKQHFPNWATNYINLPPNKKIENVTNDFKGFVKIDTLPNLLQLAINAHQHFMWEEVDFSSQKGRNDFKKDATKYLKEHASTLKIPHSDRTKSSEFGLSKATLDTFLMSIKPDIE
jgi:hypothetical protein